MENLSEQDSLDFIVSSFSSTFEKVWVTVEYGNLIIGVLHKGYALKYCEGYYLNFLKIVHMQHLETWCMELKAKFMEAYENEKVKSPLQRVEPIFDDPVKSL